MHGSIATLTPSTARSRLPSAAKFHQEWVEGLGLCWRLIASCCNPVGLGFALVFFSGCTVLCRSGTWSNLQTLASLGTCDTTMPVWWTIQFSQQEMSCHKIYSERCITFCRLYWQSSDNYLSWSHKRSFCLIASILLSSINISRSVCCRVWLRWDCKSTCKCT